MADSATAFRNATGYSYEQIYYLIASMILIAIFLWSAWVAYSYYTQWAKEENNIGLYDVAGSIARSLIIITILIYLLT